MYYAIDLETTGLDPRESRILCMGYYSPTDKGVLTDLNAIKEWLQLHEKDKFIFHNGKFDCNFLAAHLNLTVLNSFDTQLAAYLLPERCDSLSLGALVEYYLAIPDYKENKFRKSLEDEPLEDVCAYCLTDCEYTYKVAQVLLAKLVETDNYGFFSRYFMPSVNLLRDVETSGIAVNKGMIEEVWKEKTKSIEEYDQYLREKYKDLIFEYEEKLVDEHLAKHPKSRSTKEELLKKDKFKFNFNSTKQRLWLLKDKLGFPCTVEVTSGGKTKKSFSTKDDVIEEYIGKHPIVEDLLQIKEIKKQEQDTFKILDNIGKDGKIHPTFNLTVTDTGRLSCKNPNLQQIPRNKD